MEKLKTRQKLPRMVIVRCFVWTSFVSIAGFLTPCLIIGKRRVCQARIIGIHHNFFVEKLSLTVHFGRVLNLEKINDQDTLNLNDLGGPLIVNGPVFGNTDSTSVSK
jgi:hypothetical protein